MKNNFAVSKQNQPLVSVIIPTQNRQECLVKAVKSVQDQTYRNIELIIINDFSADQTREVAFNLGKQYQNIALFNNERKMGFVKSLNKGAELASGKYIARLDDDDTWCDREKIEKQVDFLENNKDYVLTGGGVIKVNKEGKEIIKFSVPKKDEEIRKVILVNNVFAHSSVVFRKGDFIKAGKYDEQFGFFADWALWLELGKIGKFYNFQEFFIRYLDQEENKTNSARDRQIRRKLLAKFRLNMKYKKYYYGRNKALLLSFASYCYSFIPFRKKLWPIIFQIRKLLFGHPPYRYFE